MKALMRRSFGAGFSFGLTSGVITTLGLMVGLEASTGSRLAVIGGVLTIAVADAFSDALGMHVSQESENKFSVREIWEATIMTFVAKFLFAMTFVVPIMFFSLTRAVEICILWGLLILGLYSYYLARRERIPPSKVIGEHLIIALIVVILTHYIGNVIAIVFL
ncbi:MAG: hypothetical protein WC471_02390 [Candidatus Woesearchaeota archaeon]